MLRSPVAPLKVAVSARPEGRPVDADVLKAIEQTASILETLGHDVVEAEAPVRGWKDIFGPLVLDDELRERQHLLAQPDLLTHYELTTLRAAMRLSSADVSAARSRLDGFRTRMDRFLGEYDVLLTPTAATTAFPHGERPTSIDWLWGAFPFTAPFNVAATPAVTLPVGVADGLPIGAQLVARRGRDAFLLDVAETVEAAIGFDHGPVRERWTLPARNAVAS